MKHLLLLLSILIFSGVYSQDEIQADILELNFLGESDPKNLMIFQNQIYFTANDGMHGRELWKIENDLPVLVMDITEGSNDAFNDNCIFLVTNEYIYFTTTNGKRLWKSDGTEMGTTLLLSNIESDYSSFSEMIEYNSKIYFRYNDGIHGFELWETDGTIEGTTMVKDIYEGSNGSEILSFFIFNDQLFFTAIDGEIANKRELWKTDGTENGTVILKDIGGQTNYDGVKHNNDFLILNDHFFFYGFTPGLGYELWKSDGTEQGTQMVKDINPGNAYNEDFLFGAVGNDHIVFRAFSPDSGYELWRSNGTEAGTYKIKEINPNYGSNGDGVLSSAYGGEIFSYNGKVYFNGTDGNFNKLWVTDGTEQGTFKYLDLDVEGNESYRSFEISNNQLYFMNNKRVVRTQGITSEVFVNMENSGGISRFKPFQDKVYFVKNFDDFNGLEIWESEINNQNLKVLEINSRQGSSPRNFASFGDKVVFFGHNYTYYEVPMISDGTQQGTKSILNNPSFAVDNNYAALLFKAGNNLFFRARAGQNNWELYKTDGTPQGTGLVKDLTENGSAGLVRELYANYNEILYFVGNDNLTGTELYRSDGTEEGTYKVIDLIPGPGYGPFIYSFGVHQDHLYFSGGLGTWENFIPTIWKTNGTAGGTEQVLQFQQGVWADRPFILASIGENIFIYKNNDPEGYSLYGYNSTQDNLQLLKNFDIHIMGGIEMSGIEFNGKFYFIDHSYNNNLYVSDGTVNGTYMVNEDSQFTSRIFDLFACGNYLYFRESVESAASNLWRTDGTSDGTIKLVEDNEDYHEYINNFTCYNSNVLFTKGISWSNTLNITNGEPNGLTSVDITLDDNYIFGAYEGISSLFVNQNKLYLTIYNRKNGEELYIADPEFLLSTEEINEGLNKDDSNVLIYPNPTSSEINVVSNDQSKIKQIQLYDLTGKLMEIGIYNANEVKLNLQKYSSGIYLLKVQTEKSTTTKKVIIK